MDSGFGIASGLKPRVFIKQLEQLERQLLAYDHVWLQEL